ncbi:hypothetical protein LCGC14_0934760 [marine sediment metagenome]|uniref:AAA+ ATPase domain-containing protein n=1 Tax=marine sediment metagenome TaxID=412755 RepID=A0A0F9NRB5_9ZZZZ
MTVTSINKIKTTAVKRLPTGLSSIDRLYGKTDWKDPQGNKKMTWGFPDKTISLWAGQGGIGKSRLAVEVAKIITQKRYKVLYFQNEMPESTFANKILATGTVSNYFYLSESKTLAEQIKEIKEIKPHLVIVDSITMLEDFGLGSDRKIKTVIEAYRELIMKQNGHIILLSQLTKAGDTRGSTVLPHLVDAVFKLRTSGPGIFWFEVENKNRYGEVGPTYSSLWEHHDHGVIELSQGYEYEDFNWCETHNLPYESFLMGVERRRKENALERVQEDKAFAKIEKNHNILCVLILLAIGALRVFVWAVIGLASGAAGGMYEMSHGKDG